MTENILTIVIVVLALLFVCSAMVAFSLHGQRADLREEVAIGRRENSALLDRIENLTAENEEFRQQNKRLYKVTMPSFGEPKLKRYNPLDYEVPLVCPTCKETLVAKEDFYEIPVTNEPGTVVAVHLRCEREVKLG
jgi:hypothetical protein